MDNMFDMVRQSNKTILYVLKKNPKNLMLKSLLDGL